MRELSSQGSTRYLPSGPSVSRLRSPSSTLCSVAKGIGTAYRAGSALVPVSGSRPDQYGTYCYFSDTRNQRAGSKQALSRCFVVLVYRSISLPVLNSCPIRVLASAPPSVSSSMGTIRPVSDGSTWLISICNWVGRRHREARPRPSSVLVEQPLRFFLHALLSPAKGPHPVSDASY
ncbi:hypothetical protein OH77DRAFT_531607 [Trametes cingulata]|nr:hypothetical protein OH77DRAFT_531607 [Trametes cingulata]